MSFLGSLSGKSSKSNAFCCWSQAQWQRFAGQLREFIREYDVIDFTLLSYVPRRESELKEEMENARKDVWSKGGCYVLAKALQAWMGGGRILYVPSDDVGGFEHAFLECVTPFGPVYIDDSGHAWTQAETESGIAWRFRGSAYGGQLPITDVWTGKIDPWQLRAAKALAGQLSKKFGAFSDLVP